MLSRRLSRPTIALAVFIVILLLALYGWHSIPLPLRHQSSPPILSQEISEGQPKHVGHPNAGYTAGAHHEIFSVSTTDRKYFKIDFSPRSGINPNAIPHPTLKDHWVIVGQLDDHLLDISVWLAELVCTATFKGGVLSCINAPLILSIGKTPVSAYLHNKYTEARLTSMKGNGNCTGDVGYYNFSIGPRDARIFYGPTGPWAIYGSLSEYTCLGLWMQDFRVLTEWPFDFFDPELFRNPTEIQRPGGKYGSFEKNFFIFWDKDENFYAHHDIYPKRVFAQLSKDGSVGPDLAPQAAANDEVCMAKYMPKLQNQERIHQATNSISITLCKRADSECKPDNSNTFILTIFQVKKFYDEHCVYEPYVMLFQQQQPFAVHGISTKPFWVSGRGKPGEWKTPEDEKTIDQTQMLYITSVSWKEEGLGYHGFIDDVLFVLFGIEDNGSGGIDIVARDLLADMALCATD